MLNTPGAQLITDAFASLAIAFATEPAKPTIILVHGAFTAPWIWDGVIARLNDDGFQAIAPINPLRCLHGDAASIAAVARSIPGDIILVGHAYAGLVITEAAHGNGNTKALVYVTAFIPDVGESALTLSIKFPGCTLADALEPAKLPGGDTELRIQSGQFRRQVAADVPDDVAALMAMTQRPITRAALLGEATIATWKTLPAFSIYGAADRNIPVATGAYMAARARVAETVEVTGGSHALMVSHPDEVASLIAEAAAVVHRSRLSAP